MLRHALLLMFLYGVRSGAGRPQGDVAEAREQVQRERMEESDVGAGGSGASAENVGLGMKNPVQKDGLPSIHEGQMLLVPALRHGEMVEKPRRNPQNSAIAKFFEYLDRDKTADEFVTSPVLHVNKSGGWRKTERYPAEAIVVKTYNPDGTVKSSVTHFRAVGVPAGYGPGPTEGFPVRRLTWPFASYFPIVINDPFLAAYNGFYNAFSPVVEYGPDADICRSKNDQAVKEVTLDAEVKLVKPKTERTRKRRETTGIQMNFEDGDRVDVKVEEPPFRSNVFIPAEAEERTRAHSVMLVNPPPISSIAKPSTSGFNLKKKASKPQKPDTEGSEEVGEETEDATQSGGSDGVAVSPPPDGASVAEAKPVGLAIAGPGGVAAAKPQGTAVAGPGGLAIARPIGTAIAGVEVEGTVPIGGQQKNKKKKPKQDPEKMDDETDTELHYVGGLTGPIGNPQPNTKDFGKEMAAKSRSQENLLFQGKFDGNGYQLKLGEQDGKYGFVPLMASPLRSSDRLQKRMDHPTFFHGLLGNRNADPQINQPRVYPNFYY